MSDDEISDVPTAAPRSSPSTTSVLAKSTSSTSLGLGKTSATSGVAKSTSTTSEKKLAKIGHQLFPSGSACKCRTGLPGIFSLTLHFIETGFCTEISVHLFCFFSSFPPSVFDSLSLSLFLFLFLFSRRLFAREFQPDSNFIRSYSRLKKRRKMRGRGGGGQRNLSFVCVCFFHFYVSHYSLQCTFVPLSHNRLASKTTKTATSGRRAPTDAQKRSAKHAQSGREHATEAEEPATSGRAVYQGEQGRSRESNQPAVWTKEPAAEWCLPISEQISSGRRGQGEREGSQEESVDAAEAGREKSARPHPCCANTSSEEAGTGCARLCASQQRRNRRQVRVFSVWRKLPCFTVILSLHSGRHTQVHAHACARAHTHTHTHTRARACARKCCLTFSMFRYGLSTNRCY